MVSARFPSGSDYNLIQSGLVVKALILFQTTRTLDVTSWALDVTSLALDVTTFMPDLTTRALDVTAKFLRETSNG